MQNDNVPVILAIDTSCDETSVAVLRGDKILSNCLYSQLDLHARYGGVVPSIARVEHEKKFPDVLQEAIEKSGIVLQDIDHVAVTTGPGLAIALEVGVQKAKELASDLQIPLIAVNHMAGHLFSSLGTDKINFPVLALLISGGHTELLLLDDLKTYRKVGQSLDDACGEAFDKAARVLGLPYPGGPAISKLATEARKEWNVNFRRENQSLLVVVERKKHDEDKNISSSMIYELPVPMMFSDDLNVSYSGLKSAFKRLVAKIITGDNYAKTPSTEDMESQISEEHKRPLALAFETAAVEAIVRKVEKGVGEYMVKELWLGGGVAANMYLRERIEGVAASHEIISRIPKDKLLMTDNAGMIGLAAYVGLKEQVTSYIKLYNPADLDKVDREPSWEL
jgi:N6-L-threonylcarbamoyladenine synthase